MKVGDLVALFLPCTPYGSPREMIDTGIVEDVDKTLNRASIRCCKMGLQEIKLDNTWLEVIGE